MSWRAEIHDPALFELHGLGLTDYHITRRMLHSGHPVCFQDVIDARRRLGLKPNSANPAKPPPPEAKPNPLAQAKAWLGKRLEEKQGEYWLDGRPTNLERILRAYNAMRVAMGLEQITLNERWRVEV